MTTFQCDHYMVLKATVNIHHILQKVIRYKTVYSPSTFMVCDIRKRIMVRFVARDIKDLTFRKVCFSEKYDIELFYPTNNVVIF